MTKRQYKTPAEAAAEGLFSRAELKRQFRLKPAPGQRPVCQVWQGRGLYSVFAAADCVPMRPVKPLTNKQQAALAAGRELVGTAICKQCGERKDKYFTKRGVCLSCIRANEDARYQARLDARDLSPLPSAPTVYLDTETTGLYPSDGAEIIEVAICDDDGNALVNSFVKPTQRTEWPDAQAINGISPAMVADAPLLADLLPAIRAAVAGKRVVIYNAGFDVKFFPADLFDGCDIKCCMLRYAEHAGDWNDSRRDWRWHKLTSAAYDVGHAWTGDAHRALGDTLATRSVWRWMQEQTR